MYGSGAFSMRWGFTWTVCALSALPALLRAETVHLVAQLDGEQAAACAGTGSPATGTGTFTLDTETGELQYRIEFEADKLLGPENNAHIHGPAQRCVNAGVLVPLPLGNPKEGTANVDAATVAALLAEETYVNIHTDAHPAGEIRGQIVRAPETPAGGAWGYALLALGAACGGAVLLARRRRSPGAACAGG